MVATLACKKCNVRRYALHLFAFFQAGAARDVFYLFFCLDAKEPKDQGQTNAPPFGRPAHTHTRHEKPRAGFIAGIGWSACRLFADVPLLR